MLRGWLHLGAAPIVFLAGIFLVASGPTLAGRLSAAVYTITAVILFSTSAIYHRGTGREGLLRFLRRLDHANIFLIIAGTYTPLACSYFRTAPRSCAVDRVGRRTAGPHANLLWHQRAAVALLPLYVALGWVAIGFIGPFRDAGGAAVMWLVVAGGVAYTAGALIYGFKWPNPIAQVLRVPRDLPLADDTAFICHYVAASIAIYRA